MYLDILRDDALLEYFLLCGLWSLAGQQVRQVSIICYSIVRIGGFFKIYKGKIYLFFILNIYSSLPNHFTKMTL